MVSLLKVFVVLILLVALVIRAEEQVNDVDVVVLGEDNFDETLAKNEFVFVEFYAPWCGHCKHLAPEYAKVATTLKQEGSPVVIAKVDATVHTALGTKFAVRGYPTLKFFKSSNPMDYEGGRTADDIVTWIKRKTGPPSKHLTTAEEVETFKAQTGTKIIAHLESNDAEDKETKKWLQAASSGKLEDFSLGHITDSKLHDQTQIPTAVIYKEGESPIVFNEDKFTKTKILAWAAAEGYPLISELAQQLWQRSQSSQTPLVAIFIQQGNEEHLKLANEIAKQLKGKALFGWSVTGNLAERWGASGKVIPTSIVLKWVDSNSKFVIFDEENEVFSLETGVNFVTKALAGEYKGFRKSEPIPAKNDDPVKIIVGKNYDQIVNDASKDVLVEFYAPWCGHCKKLAPIWEELGEAFESVDSVVIAKMDATANSPPENVDVKGFPTIIFFPADNKAGVTYSGERDLASLKKYLIDNASQKLNKDEL